jgi:hypothetical protein
MRALQQQLVQQRLQRIVVEGHLCGVVVPEVPPHAGGAVDAILRQAKGGGGWVLCA